MAYTPNSINRVSGGEQQLHIYKTADAIATVTASGYFNAATNMLRQFDIIMVVSETGGTAKVDNIVVTSATGAAVVTTGSTEGVTAT